MPGGLGSCVVCRAVSTTAVGHVCLAGIFPADYFPPEKISALNTLDVKLVMSVLADRTAIRFGN